MPTMTQMLLAAAKRRQALKSDYALAQRLGISTQRIYPYMKGEYELADDETIAKAAQLAGLNPLEAVARFAAERALTPAGRDLWGGIVQAVRARAKMVGRVGIEPTTNWLKAFLTWLRGPAALAV